MFHISSQECPVKMWAAQLEFIFFFKFFTYIFDGSFRYTFNFFSSQRKCSLHPWMRCILSSEIDNQQVRDIFTYSVDVTPTLIVIPSMGKHIPLDNRIENLIKSMVTSHLFKDVHLFSSSDSFPHLRRRCRFRSIYWKPNEDNIALFVG